MNVGFFMKIQVYVHSNFLEVTGFGGARHFSLEDTLDCGQCFRFSSQPDGSFLGVVGQSLVHGRQNGDSLYFYGTNEEEFHHLIKPYFDLDRDYAALKRAFSRDPVLAKAVRYAPGIRVLRQDTWEALCSFIFSQNNNIKRIKGIIARFCEHFGQELPHHPGHYAFPTPQRVSGLTPEGLAPLRSGFRAKYILDAAKKVCDGTVDLPALSRLPLEEARASLMAIKGVGPKVAECVLLYGASRLEAFPRDVWINRAMENLFPKGLPSFTREYAGIAQQYIFHYVRVGNGIQAEAESS